VTSVFKNWPTKASLAAFSASPEVDLVEVPDDSISLLIQTGHADTVRSVNYLDAKRIVSIGYDGIARISNIETGKELQRLGRYSSPTGIFAVVDHQRRWLLIADDHDVTQWDIKAAKKIRTIPTSGIESIEIHGDRLVVLLSTK